MADWTPGPWRMRNRNEVEGANGLSVALISGDPEDARLISLAPEMAELLERWLYWEGDGDLAPQIMPPPRSFGVGEFEGEARTLLARARGEMRQHESPPPDEGQRASA